jgi:APA family basic amino acid/polyamine antiporter
LGILINTLLEKPTESLAGVGLTLIGIPVYYYWKRKNNSGLKDTSPVKQ